MKPYLIEEAYEVLDALDASDIAKLSEELGDLLLQVLMHAQLATEEQEFTLEDVFYGISTKLIRRHPHVFGDLSLSTSTEVLRNWDKIKRQEKGAETSILESVPKQMPALAYAQAIQDRAARVGFDWRQVEGVLEKVAEEIQEIKEAENYEERLSEFGDLFFSLVNVARWLDIDAEEALRLTNQRFRLRFMTMEKLCAQRGLKMSELPLEKLDELWEEAKTSSVG